MCCSGVWTAELTCQHHEFFPLSQSFREEAHPAFGPSDLSWTTEVLAPYALCCSLCADLQDLPLSPSGREKPFPPCVPSATGAGGLSCCCG